MQNGGGDRLLRAGSLARYLASAGHQVVWWTSTFDHLRKQHVLPQDSSVDINPNWQIRFFRGSGYKRHISLRRLYDHRLIARKFARAIEREPMKPDVIVSSFPTIELAEAAVEFGDHHGIPTVLDLRDMWPDIFVDHLPAMGRPLLRLALQPLFRRARRTCRRATALFGITEDFLKWGLGMAGRARTRLDANFPFTYPATVHTEEELRVADEFWDSKGITNSQEHLVVTFVGTVGHQLDLLHVIACAREIGCSHPHVRFVLCGTGDLLETCRQAASGLPNVLLPGWVNAVQIKALLRRTSLGLDPLPSRKDFFATINNKAVEYFSAGVPVISSPKQGVLYRLLQETNSGVSYQTHDAADLARILKRFARAPGELQELSKNALALYNARFTESVVFQGMEHQLRLVTEQHKVFATQ